ncbi:MAG: hypothetical protein VR70_10450 [Rhodospirillaceae bacterium BRH_c57]|nr:MAG: hypothetical protein VR70_10450 [Rhodospirillaceae bacterium BRH_c57]
MFTNLCKDLHRLHQEKDWFSALNKARILRTLLFDDISRSGTIKNEPGYVPVAELMARHYGTVLHFQHRGKQTDREQYASSTLGVVMRYVFSVHDVIDLMSNKLGGVHLDPVFSWQTRKKGPLEKERFARIEAAFSLRVQGQSALSYFTDQITEASLDAVGSLYTRTLDDFG